MDSKVSCLLSATFFFFVNFKCPPEWCGILLKPLLKNSQQAPFCALNMLYISLCHIPVCTVNTKCCLSPTPVYIFLGWHKVSHFFKSISSWYIQGLFSYLHCEWSQEMQKHQKWGKNSILHILIIKESTWW